MYIFYFSSYVPVVILPQALDIFLCSFVVHLFYFTFYFLGNAEAAFCPSG